MLRRFERGTARVWMISELYYPEETSTGHVLTKIAEGLADRYSVLALCSQPTYSSRGRRAPARETYKGVDIERVWGSSDHDYIADAGTSLTPRYFEGGKGDDPALQGFRPR